MLSKVDWTTTGWITVTRWTQKTFYDGKQVSKAKQIPKTFYYPFLCMSFVNCQK